MLGKYGQADRVAEFNRLAAEHGAREAPTGRYVVGSVGPTGEFLARWVSCRKWRCWTVC